MKLKPEFLRAPANEYGDGSNVDEGEENELIDVEDLDDDEDDEDDQDDDDDDSSDPPEKPKKGKAPAFPQIDEDRLGEAFGRVVADRLPQRERQMSPAEQQAEFERLVGRIEVPEEIVDQLVDAQIPAAKRAAALKGLLEGAVQHALKVSGLAFKGEFGRIEQQYNPKIQQMEAFVAEQQTKNWIDTTVRQYPTLKGRGDVVRQAMVNVGKSGFTPSSKSDAIRAIGKESERLIRHFGGDQTFRLKNKKQGTQRMPPGRSGGGGGQQRSAPTSESKWLADLFPVHAK